MVRRLAATMALVAFALCILAGWQAENTFVTIVSKALLALVVTFVVGLVVGTMAQKMLDENLTPGGRAASKSGNPEAKTDAGDR